jgi:Uma2 family endonuclease
MSTISQTSTAPEVEESLMTGDALWELGLVEPCELINGQIVYMSPTGGEHGGIEVSLGAELRNHVRKHKLGYLAGGEVGIYIRRNPDTIRGADLAFFTKAQLPNGLPRKYIEAIPELVVEIVSPNDLWKEIRAKLRDYFSIGVACIWIVDPDEQKILIYRSMTDVSELNITDTLRGDGALEGFELPVATLFSDE